MKTLPNRTFSTIVVIFYPLSQFCEIDVSLLSLPTQPNTAPNLFQRGVEYGKYEGGGRTGTLTDGIGTIVILVIIIVILIILVVVMIIIVLIIVLW